MFDRWLASTTARAGAMTSAGVCGGVLVLIVSAATSLLATGARFAYTAGLTYLLGAALIVTLATRRLPAGPFGLANSVTLLRVMLTTLLLACAFEPVTDRLLWLSVLVASLALVLDGVDGWLARRRGESSSFGARFDMETDAALMLVLAVLVWRLDRAGAWVLLAGLLRYAFVAVGAVVTRMRCPLPPSTRRKTACVVQLIALVVALGPIVPSGLAAAAAAVGLIVLACSFGLDTLWLLRRA